MGTVNKARFLDDGPFCQPCYDHNTKLIRLTPRQEYVGGGGRKCEVCTKTFIETAWQPGTESGTGSLELMSPKKEA
jgi:hypothetical protein